MQGIDTDFSSQGIDLPFKYTDTARLWQEQSARPTSVPSPPTDVALTCFPRSAAVISHLFKVPRAQEQVCGACHVYSKKSQISCTLYQVSFPCSSKLNQT